MIASLHFNVKLSLFKDTSFKQVHIPWPSLRWVENFRDAVFVAHCFIQ